MAKKNQKLSVEDLSIAMGLEEDLSNNNPDNYTEAPVADDIYEGPNQNEPEDVNDQPSIDDQLNHYHSGQTDKVDMNLEDDLNLLDDEMANDDMDDANADDAGVDESSTNVDDATEPTSDGLDGTIPEDLASDGEEVAETEIIGGADDIAPVEENSEIDESSDTISNPASDMESWFNGMSIEDLEVAINDGGDVNKTINIDDNGTTSIAENGSDSSSSSDSDDDDDDDDDDDSSSPFGGDSDDDDDDDDDDDEDKDDDDDDDEDKKDEESYNPFEDLLDW